MTDINNFDDLYPGRFLKAGMFNGQPATFTIKSVQHDEIEGEKGIEKKVILSFQETPFELVLPKINAVAVKAMFGAQVPEWIGKRVTLYGTTAIMPFPKKKDEPCIRVYGSPDIDAEIRCEWSPPRRKAVVQILKPTQSPVLTAALAAIEAAPDGAPMGKFQERANQLLSENKINQQDYDKIDAAIQGRISKRRETQPQPPAAAEQSAADEGSQQIADPDATAASPDEAEVPATTSQPPSGRDNAGDLAPASDPAADSPAVSVDLKLRDRQQLIRSVNSLPADRKTELLDLLKEQFDIDSPAQLKTNLHSDYVLQFLQSE